MHAILNKQRRHLRRKCRRILYAAEIPRHLNRIRYRHSRDVCFVWVPKAAGNSVFVWLYREIRMIMASEVSEVRGAFPQRGPVTFGHMDYKELQRQGIVRPEFARSALSFAFVRNPFDRFVSLYYYLAGAQRFKGSFAQFVDRVERGVEPIGLFNVRNLSQCNPQTDWIFDDAGYPVVDYVFRMEKFADEIEVLAGMLGISPLVLHENKSPRSAGTLELLADNGLRERVSHLYRRDFDLLGYDPDCLPH